MISKDDTRGAWGRARNSWNERLPESYRGILETAYNDRSCCHRKTSCSYQPRECQCIKPCRCCEEKKEYKEAQLKGIQLQLQSNNIQTIANGENIIFNREISRQSPFISYDNVTGLVTVRKAGVYQIEWWVAIEGIVIGTDTAVTFGISSSSGHDIKASNPNTVGQIVGNALIEVFASNQVPVTFRLINETNGTVGLPQVPIKASMMITQVTDF